MHFVYMTLVIYWVAQLCSAGPIARSRLFPKRQDEPDDEAYEPSTVASQDLQIVSSSSRGDDILSIMAVTLSITGQAGSSPSPMPHQTRHESDPSDVQSAFASDAAVPSSSDVDARSSPTTTRDSSKMTATSYSRMDSQSHSTPGITSSSTASASRSTALLPATSSKPNAKSGGQTGASDTKNSEHTVTTTTTTSTTTWSLHGSTGIHPGTQWQAAHSSGLFWASSSIGSSTKTSSHLFSTAVAFSANISTSNSTGVPTGVPRTTAMPTSIWSPVGQDSSQTFGSSTALGASRSITQSSPTVGVVETLPALIPSHTSTRSYRIPETTLPKTTQTGKPISPNATGHAHPSTAIDLTASTPTVSHSVTSPHAQAATKTSITLALFTGVPTNKEPPTASQPKGTSVSNPGIVVILPGSHTITIPFNPNDGNSKTVSPPTQTLSTPATPATPLGTSEPKSTTSKAGEAPTHTSNPQPTGPEITTIRPSSTTTKVITIELTTTAQPKLSVPNTATGSGSRATTQATGSQKSTVPVPWPTSGGPDTGGSLVVNPVSPVFFTKTETVTVTERITETKTVATMTTTATVTAGNGAHG